MLAVRLLTNATEFDSMINSSEKTFISTWMQLHIILILGSNDSRFLAVMNQSPNKFLSCCRMRSLMRCGMLELLRRDGKTKIIHSMTYCTNVLIPKMVILDWFGLFQNTLKFATSMTGNRSSRAIEEFWDHCHGLDEWQGHPCLNDPSIPKKCFFTSNFWATILDPTIMKMGPNFPLTMNSILGFTWLLEKRSGGPWKLLGFLPPPRSTPKKVCMDDTSFTLYFIFPFVLCKWGLLPICIHVDGAEFYSNSEFQVWSIGCLFATGAHVFDTKFPCVTIPHTHMLDSSIKNRVNEVVAQVLAWSLKCSGKGLWPVTGPFGEELIGFRRANGGSIMAGNWRGCFFAYRADGKARKETHVFPRTYQHSFICESCLAQREHKNWDERMCYKNFHNSAAYRMTPISDMFWFRMLFCWKINVSIHSTLQHHLH